MKWLLKAFLFTAILGIIIVLYNTLKFKENENWKKVEVTDYSVKPEVLSKAITYETISHKAEMIDDSAFAGFHQYLKESFPLVDSLLYKEVLNKYALMYRWQGWDTNLAPVVLMAHMDVVPVEYATRENWEYPPFSGAVTGNYIYGRGALDDKGSLISILYAVENLLYDGYRPARTFLFCFGHDEEIGGEDGARKMAQLLEERDIKPYMVLDEGGTLSSGIVPGVSEPVALIGTAEKGYVSLELTVDLSGGHSSMPERNTAISVLSKAICALEENPLPDRLTEPLQGFIENIGPHLPFLQKMAFANTWLFSDLIFSEYKKTASGAALIHTTQVPTIFQSGIKDNLVPKRARAVVNFRLLPGDEPEEILAYCQDIVRDSSVRIAILEGMAIAASPVSDHHSEAYNRLGSVVKAIYPDAIVSPYLVLGATDARHFYRVCNKVFRFSPIPLGPEDLKRIHGVNERIAIEGFKNSVNFYASFLKDLGNS